MDLPSERNGVVLRLISRMGLGFGLLTLGLGRLELRLVAFLDLLDDPLAETVVAGAADVGGGLKEHEHHGCVFGLLMLVGEMLIYGLVLMGGSRLWPLMSEALTDPSSTLPLRSCWRQIFCSPKI